MDNSTSNSATPEQPSNSSATISLNPTQYAFYQKTYLELLTPDGRHLEYVGKVIQNESKENEVYRLREQVCLVSCLLSNVNDSVNLPMPAVLGLADLFCRVQEAWKNS